MFSPPCSITGLVQQFFRAKEHCLQNAELSRDPGLFCIPSPWAAPPGCLSAWPKCSHPGRSSFTGRESTRAVLCHLCPMVSYQRGEGSRAPKVTSALLFVVPPLILHFLLCQTQVSEASQGLDPAELEPLLGQCSPLGFQGIIPDLCWSG